VSAGCTQAAPLAMNHGALLHIRAPEEPHLGLPCLLKHQPEAHPERQEGTHRGRAKGGHEATVLTLGVGVVGLGTWPQTY